MLTATAAEGHYQVGEINRPSHEAFIVADAPDPHAIDNALVESGGVGRSHTRVVSVLSTTDVAVDTGD